MRSFSFIQEEEKEERSEWVMRQMPSTIRSVSMEMKIVFRNENLLTEMKFLREDWK